MQLRDDFAIHISELNDPLERPYSKGVDNKLFDNIEDVEHLNKEIQNINPDYLTVFTRVLLGFLLRYWLGLFFNFLVRKLFSSGYRGSSIYQW